LKIGLLQRNGSNNNFYQENIIIAAIPATDALKIYKAHNQDLFIRRYPTFQRRNNDGEVMVSQGKLTDFSLTRMTLHEKNKLDNAQLGIDHRTSP